MNWKLILQLSIFGLPMGLGTVFFIGSTIEPAFWLGIFIFCAYIIARRCPTKRFAHGVVLGLANSVCVTASHIVFFHQYLAGHAREADMMKSMPFRDDPRLMMAVMGPMVGVVSGIVLGVLAVIAGKLIKSGRPSVQKMPSGRQTSSSRDPGRSILTSQSSKTTPHGAAYIYGRGLSKPQDMRSSFVSQELCLWCSQCSI